MFDVALLLQVPCVPQFLEERYATLLFCTLELK